MGESRSRDSYISTLKSPQVIWITGLSGAGKTTISDELSLRLRASGHTVIRLDGDQLRSILGKNEYGAENHNKNTRLDLALRYAILCKTIAQPGVTVIISTISLFHKVHKWNRENLPNYYEIYLNVPLELLKKRDPKGIYKKFDKGELTQVAGLDLPVEEPVNPSLRINVKPSTTIDEIIKTIMYNINGTISM